MSLHAVLFDRSMTMDWIVVLSRLVLVVVFLVAAAGKLADREGAHQALTEFGLPVQLAQPLSIALIVAEATVMVLVLVTSTVRWGAVGALGLLGVFTIAVTVTLARGRTPSCHCFGQLRSSPIGVTTIARNVALAAVAGIVLWQGGRSPDFVAAPRHDALALGAALLALIVAGAEGWFLLNLLPQHGRMLKRLDELEAMAGITRGTGIRVGDRAPDFELRTLGGGSISLATLRLAARPVLLFFTNPYCGPCDAMLPDIARWQREYGDAVTIAVISRDAVEVNRAKADTYGLRTVLIQKRREVVQAYLVESTPAGVLVGADGRVASAIGYGAERIGALVREASGPDADRSTVQRLTPSAALHSASALG